ncbi:MAG: orotate phosphoribosyltransferase [Candidatus Micrarchaeota archaeon]|nr:orotate phosphoribosyltransferase [Candidatus Micrarchaeota archaeon]
MIKDRLIEAKAVKYGSFSLASGKKSSYYVDVKSALTDPVLLDEAASEISKRVLSRKIAGVETGATPILVATSLKLGIPFVIIRKEGQAHGMERQFIGEVSQGEEIDMIEDVVTTARSVSRGVDILRKSGARVTRAICIVDREDSGRDQLRRKGVELLELVRISDLVSNQKG